MPAALTLSPEFSARVAREAAAAGFASPEDYLADAVAGRARGPAAGPVETVDTPRGPVNAGGIVPEDQREAFIGMLMDRDAAFDSGEGVPWDVARVRIRERIEAALAADAAGPAA